VTDDPLEFIKISVRQKKIVWTHHVNMRLEGRFISREALLSSVESYEMLEEYPKDKYLPSYLIYAKLDEEIFHVHFAVDRENDHVRVVTAYRPTLDKWEEGFKKRRQK